MRKRMLCLLLAAALLLGMGWIAPVSAKAASSLTTSDNAVSTLKNMEGFSQYPYLDQGVYYVGYGTTCPEADLARYQSSGITEAEAVELMQVHLTKIGEALNKFADSNGLTFTQNKFDALVLFSYNVGTAWLKETSDFRTAVLNGTRGNDFIYYMSRWCTYAGTIEKGLINRRLAEANLYLNGVYGSSCPAYYGYVLFDGNGGTRTSGVQGYDAADTAKIKVKAAMDGFAFLGWYTAKDGGALVTDLDTSVKGKTLYAHWQSPDSQGVAANYQRTVTSTANLYKMDGSGSVAGTVTAGQTVTVTMDYLDEDGIHWGKTSNGWLDMSHTAQSLSKATKPNFSQSGISVAVTVTNSYVNVRSGPGTSYAQVGRVYQGDSLLITETTAVNNALWGKFEGGWLSLQYTNYDAVKNGNSGNTGNAGNTGNSGSTGNSGTNPGIHVAVKVTNSYVNVRSGPGTSYALVGQVYQGDTLLITETTTVNKALWGKFDKGWLSLMYTNFDTAQSGNTGSNTGSGNSGNTGNSGATQETVIATGTVVDCNELRIRSGPGTNYKQVGALVNGTYVEITQRQMVGGMEWGKMYKGWISLSYVKLTEKKPAADQKPDSQAPSQGENVAPNSNSSGTVINCTVLNVRSTPGTDKPLVTTIPRGSKVKIYETSVYKNEPWGRIDQGWVHMAYIQLDYVSSDMGSTGEGVKGTVYNCTKLNVRPAPGTNNTPVASLYPGAQVTIYEETTVGNMHWGRIDQGWVCMDYIKLAQGNAATGVPTEKVEGARTGVVINTNALRVRSGAGTHNAQIGTLNMGTIVIVYEQTTVKGAAWGRIDQGWVCLDYIKLDPENGSFNGIVTMEGLTIHEKPGASDAGIGSYHKGDMVTIVETASVSGVAWGRTNKGWICLTYVIR